jgi:hypothetical protein
VREPLGQQLVPDLGPILVAPELREWLDVRFSYAFSIRVGQLARADGLTRGLQFYRQQSFRFTLRLFRELLLEFTSYNTQPVRDPKFLITWGRIHRLRYRSTSPSVAGLTISRSVSKTALCPEDMAAFYNPSKMLPAAAVWLPAVRCELHQGSELGFCWQPTSLSTIMRRRSSELT